MEKEIFRDIVGFEGHYMVSNQGRVISIKFGKNKELKPFLWANGRYYYFHTCVNGIHKSVSVAQSVAKAFPEICGEWFDGGTVDHINTITTDNRAENIRVVSLKENINNPTTISKMRKYETDEERKENIRQQHRDSYQRCKEYYRDYYRDYYKKHPEKYKEYYEKYNSNLTEEQKEKRRQKSREYYYKHRDKTMPKKEKIEIDIISKVD